MKITVVGCGKIGTTVLSSLVSEGHDVVAVDNDPAVISNITNIYDVMCVTGNGVDAETLMEAGVPSADLFIAATGSDELNMLSCFVARRLGAGHTVAKISNPEYNDTSIGFMQKHLDLSLALNPELRAAHEIYNVLKLPAAAKIETFSGRNFEVVELLIKSDCGLVGMSLSELRRTHKGSYLICVVRRGDEVYIPTGAFVLQEGDRIGLAATPTEVQRLLKMLGLSQKQARNIMILGASRTSFYLSRLLLAGGSQVKIVELDREKCASFAERLPGVTMINGDGAQQELLLEEGLPGMDAFVTLTGMDEENLLLSVFASGIGVPKVVPKVNRDEFTAMGHRLGIEFAVSPRRTVSDIIVRYARALENSAGSNVESLYNLMDGKAEALEFSVTADCPLIDKPLRELKLKAGTLIAGIQRGRKTVIPSGDDVIAAGDRVIVVAAEQRLGDLSEVLR